MDRKYAEYLLKKTKDDYNLIAEDFSRTRAGIPKVVEQKPLKDYILAGERILDLGCGNGRLYELFKDCSIDYYGVDFSEKLIEIAKNHYPKAKFQITDALNLPFPNNFFDKVLSVAVFHQIPSEEFRRRFLTEIKRVLKPEGYLILTVWYLWREKKVRKLIFKYTLSKLIGKSELDFKDIFLPWKNSKGEIKVQRYYHCFTKKELIKIFQDVNLKIKEIDLVKHPEGHYNIFLVAEK